MITLASPITALKGVGPSGSVKLKRLGIKTVGDLLFHLPRGYNDYRKTYAIESAPLGVNLMMLGEFTDCKQRRSWNRRLVITAGVFQDTTGTLAVTWFGRFPIRMPEIGRQVRLFGSIETKDGKRQVVNPTWEYFEKSSETAGVILPLYPLTQGLSQISMRKFVREALERVAIADWFSDSFLQEQELLSLQEAIEVIHAPTDDKQMVVAKRRLAFDELFFVTLMGVHARQERETLEAPVIEEDPKSIVAKLTFKLTDEQQVVIDDITHDFQSGRPMQRLLQGEVGSGKTAVAAVAATMMAKAGWQTIIIVPTEVLANQQYQALLQFFEPLHVSLALLTRTIKDKKETLGVMARGEVDVIIGTHAILQEAVEGAKVGFVVIDEQHRFGVGQRLTARTKGKEIAPHVLSMTATPIPRTLQLVYMGDLDVSTIKTLPHGERKVKTMLFGQMERKKVEFAMRRRIAKGEQIFVVCPLIDPSDTLGQKSATEEYERLRKEGFVKTRIGLLHGKMKPEEKAKTLEDFRSHKLDMLVATTVIEVGIDVPNATVIVIEGAERFGLAQLHQLRGRVGRAGQEGVCVLFQGNESGEAAKRLKAFSQTSSGFALADLDLKLRGPGEWFGRAQSGFPDFQVADLANTTFVNNVQKAARAMAEADPDLKKEPGVKKRLRELLTERFEVS